MQGALRAAAARVPKAGVAPNGPPWDFCRAPKRHLLDYYYFLLLDPGPEASMGPGKTIHTVSDAGRFEGSRIQGGSDAGRFEGSRIQGCRMHGALRAAASKVVGCLAL